MLGRAANEPTDSEGCQCVAIHAVGWSLQRASKSACANHGLSVTGVSSPSVFGTRASSGSSRKVCSTTAQSLSVDIGVVGPTAGFAAFTGARCDNPVGGVGADENVALSAGATPTIIGTSQSIWRDVDRLSKLEQFKSTSSLPSLSMHRADFGNVAGRRSVARCPFVG